MVLKTVIFTLLGIFKFRITQKFLHGAIEHLYISLNVATEIFRNYESSEFSCPDLIMCTYTYIYNIVSL